MTDQTHVLSAVGDLLAVGARRGAAQVLFCASLIAQREAAEVPDLTEWTPSGPVPLRRKAEKHPAAANDHPSTPEKPADTVA